MIEKRLEIHFSPDITIVKPVKQQTPATKLLSRNYVETKTVIAFKPEVKELEK